MLCHSQSSRMVQRSWERGLFGCEWMVVKVSRPGQHTCSVLPSSFRTRLTLLLSELESETLDCAFRCISVELPLDELVVEGGV